MKISVWAAALMLAVPALIIAEPQAKPLKFEVTSTASLCHLGPSQIDKSDEGTTGVTLMMEAIDGRDADKAKEAWDLFEGLRKKDPFAQEYAAYQWFCEYVMAPADQKNSMLGDKMTKAYFKFFSGEKFRNLREYVTRQFRLKNLQESDPERALEHAHFVEDVLIYNSPKRDAWEQTSKVLELLKLQPGAKVADIGSGSGYFTWRLADMVGKKGKVYAIDVHQEHIFFVDRFAREYGYRNIKTVKSAKDDITLREPVDMVFMDSVYHLIYITANEQFRRKFLSSMKRVLKPGGKLVLVETSPSPESELLGSSIAKELLIGHFQHLGFSLDSQHEITPMRYALVFTHVSPEEGDPLPSQRRSNK